MGMSGGGGPCGGGLGSGALENTCTLELPDASAPDVAMTQPWLFAKKDDRPLTSTFMTGHTSTGGRLPLWARAERFRTNLGARGQGRAHVVLQSCFVLTNK